MPLHFANRVRVWILEPLKMCFCCNDTEDRDSNRGTLAEKLKIPKIDSSTPETPSIQQVP
jgi:hypothetical protein